MFLEEKNEPNARQALREPTLAGFIAFCESKPADERYDYMDNTRCAFGQYLNDACNLRGAHCGGKWWGLEGCMTERPMPFNPLVLVEHPHVFGELARRLRAL